MARINGVRQRVHQPFWSSLIRTTGVPTTPVSSGTRLFASLGANQGGDTNMQTAGQLPSDQTYVILAARMFMYFEGTNMRANYRNVSAQLFCTLAVGDKPQFHAPAWYFPAGGGIAGLDSTTPILNNGEPSAKSIMTFARPIPVPVRQHFSVTCDFWSVGTTNALTLLNAGAVDDQKVITFYIDGVHTRDVE